MRYRSLGKPRPYQAPATDFIVSHPTAGLIAYPGTGKTRIVLDAITRLASSPDSPRPLKALVLAPLSTVHAVWVREAEKWTTVPITTAVNPTKAKRIESIRSFIDSPGAQILATNYETCRTCLPELVAYVLPRVDMVIADESRRLANGRAQLTKGAMAFSRYAPRRVILTGTPISKSPLDLFTQILWLDKGTTFGRFYLRWRESFFTIHPSGFGWVPKFNTVRRLADAIKPFTYEIGERDVRLPEKNFIPVEIPYTKQQAKIASDLTGEYRAVINEKTYSTMWATAVWEKMTQVASGCVLIPPTLVEIDSPKWPWLSEFVKDTLPPGETVVLFATHRSTLSRARRILEAAGRRCVEVHGGVSSPNRLRAVADVEAHRADAFLAQIEAGKFGLSLPRSRYLAFLEPPRGVESYEQAIARIVRPAHYADSQDIPPVFIYEVAVGAHERHLYRTLRKGKDVLREFISYLRTGQEAA